VSQEINFLKLSMQLIIGPAHDATRHSWYQWSDIPTVVPVLFDKLQLRALDARC